MFAISCSHDPEPINFNTDQCIHCKMTIEDSRFGAEIVSKKGKIFKFDATECMIKYINKGMIQEDEIEKMYVIDFYHPSKLIDATSATYLISPNLPSPMGANLSAFLNKSAAESRKNSSSGDLYGWNDLKLKFKK
jgi:copper chaperone NosL